MASSFCPPPTPSTGLLQDSKTSLSHCLASSKTLTVEPKSQINERSRADRGHNFLKKLALLMKMLDFFSRFGNLSFGGFIMRNKVSGWQAADLVGYASKGTFTSHTKVTGMCCLWRSWDVDVCSPHNHKAVRMPVTIHHIWAVLCTQDLYTHNSLML